MHQDLEEIKNKLHAAASAHYDDNVFSYMSFMLNYAEGELHDHGDWISKFKSADAMRKYYSDMSRGTFLDNLGRIVKGNDNLTSLCHCGLTITFTEDQRAALEKNSRILRRARWFAAIGLRFTACNFGERVFLLCKCISMHIRMPLFGVASGEKDEMVACMGRLGVHWKAFAEAMRLSFPDVQLLARKRSLNSTAMCQFARIAKHCDWKPADLVTSKGVVLFSGFMHTVMNEHANKLLREAEVKDSSAKNVAEFKAWEVPQSRGLL